MKSLKTNFIAFIIVMFVMMMSIFIGSAHAGGVTDINDGHTGDVFVSTGVNHGGNSVGQWVDASNFKGVKGDKGDQGIQGVKGDKGDTGATGLHGIQGVKGEKGDQGVAGVNGINGKDGDKGDKGDTGLKGEQGNIGATGATGASYDPAILNAQNNQLNDMNNRISQMEQTQGIIGAEVRLYDGKSWTITSFADYSANRSTIDRAGLRFTYKVGKSYSDKRIDELEAKLNKLTGFQQGKTEVPTGEFYTDGSAVGIKERF